MRFHEFIFKQMLKVSAFYLEKKKFIPIKIFLKAVQYQNKRALFTDPIFSEDFGETGMLETGTGKGQGVPPPQIWQIR